MGSADTGRSGGGRGPSDEPLGTVWIYCSYPVVAAGLGSAFEERARVHLGGGAPAEGVVPSCVIFDAGGPDTLSEGMQRIRSVSPEVPVLVFSVRADPPLIRAALRLGAQGCIHGGMELDQIARATEVAARGEIVVPRKLLEHLVADETPAADLEALTERQREILELVAKGYSNARVAADLFLSESTVKQHLRAAYKVLGVSDRKEAARLINGR